MDADDRNFSTDGPSQSCDREPPDHMTPQALPPRRPIYCNCFRVEGERLRRSGQRAPMQINKPAGGGTDCLVASAGMGDGVIAGAVILAVDVHDAFEYKTRLG